MAEIFIISDTHFGHTGMCKFLRKDGTKVRPWDDVSEMDAAMIENWNRAVRPRDRVIHLGDVAINKKYLNVLGRLNGDKILIKGNHDKFKLKVYTEYFKDIRGTHKFNSNFILSHYPIHPECLSSNQWNFHGHIHHKSVLLDNGEIDPRYFNCCVEHLNYTPMPIEKAMKKARKQ